MSPRKKKSSYWFSLFLLLFLHRNHASFPVLSSIPLVSNSWLKPMLFLLHNRADLCHLRAEVLGFSTISACFCYYLKSDEMRAAVTDEERLAGGFWRWGAPLDVRMGPHLLDNLAVGGLLTRVKKSQVVKEGGITGDREWGWSDLNIRELILWSITVARKALCGRFIMIKT